jgi:leukotriene-A4 hydrolase
MANQKRDYQTLSNYHEIITTQVSLNFDIDFEKKKLAGNVILKLKAVVDDPSVIILDTRYVHQKQARLTA